MELASRPPKHSAQRRELELGVLCTGMKVWGIDLKVTQVTRHSNTAKYKEMQGGRPMKREAVLHSDL